MSGLEDDLKCVLDWNFCKVEEDWMRTFWISYELIIVNLEQLSIQYPANLMRQVSGVCSLWCIIGNLNCVLLIMQLVWLSTHDIYFLKKTWLVYNEINLKHTCRHHQHGRWQARIGRVAGNKDLYLGTFGN